MVIQEEENAEVAPGIIIRQELLTPNTQFNPDVATDIRLVYSKYKTIEIPLDIIGMRIDDATLKLQEMGVDVMLSALDQTTLTDEQKAAISIGTVVQTTPAAGTTYTQEDGSNVVIYYY